MKKNKRKFAKKQVQLAKVKPDNTPTWKEVLDKYNGGHSTTIFGVIVDWDGNPITGKY